MATANATAAHPDLFIETSRTGWQRQSKANALPMARFRGCFQ
jgi:hypothetical protein